MCVSYYTLFSVRFQELIRQLDAILFTTKLLMAFILYYEKSY